MSDRERVEALARILHEVIMPGQKHPEDDPRDEWPCRDWATRLLDSPAMRDLLAEAKADALTDLADQWDLTWNRGHDRSVHPYSDDLRAAANPYRETTTGADT